ncbi:MAG: stage II sporulation protein P [Peptococcaceae bacterium]
MFRFKRRILFYRFTNRKAKLYVLLIILALSIVSAWGIIINHSADEAAVAVSTGEFSEQPGSLLQGFNKTLQLFDISEGKMKTILSEGCPLVALPASGENHDLPDPVRLLTLGLSYITDLNSSNPVTIFKSQMAVLAAVDPNELPVNIVENPSAPAYDEEEDFYLETPPGLDDWHFEIDETAPVELTKDPVVFIYNTHNAETYKPTDGTSKQEGKNSGIVKVAKVMAESLESQEGLKTIRSEVIHDFPDFTRSYIKSLETAQKVLKANKTIRAVFDVHRDAGFKSKSTTTIKIAGKEAASVMIVVGTEHERWKSNLAFAEKLEAKANQLYPGLIRDIRIADNRRYNQHLHPNSLILEVGSDLNTLEEARYSASLMATVVGQVIKEMPN